VAQHPAVAPGQPVESALLVQRQAPQLLAVQASLWVVAGERQSDFAAEEEGETLVIQASCCVAARFGLR